MRIVPPLQTINLLEQQPRRVGTSFLLEQEIRDQREEETQQGDRAARVTDDAQDLGVAVQFLIARPGLAGVGRQKNREARQVRTLARHAGRVLTRRSQGAAGR